MDEMIQIAFHKIMQSTAYTVFVLGTDEKQFAIYTEPHIGQNLQMRLTDSPRPRPYTHDLMSSLFTSLDVRIIQVVINHIDDTVYFARLFLEQEKHRGKHIIEIDARPSDALTLALDANAPLFCTKEVLQKAIPLTD
ncbi:MAG: hypothetical protein SP1CHLAM54_09890 [Chlamydiia bacterium]|nr:hypothetical protein [Chlamydiia bacterium]MCH9615895.1 hypothetical protein [Chlamydiia bacterium]MCH9628702.1 hypothetical protein [Chlamydiia bacterium]